MVCLIQRYDFLERKVEKEKKGIKVKSPEAKVDVEKASGSRGNEEDENEESASEEPSEDEIERDKLESHEGFSNRKQSECESKPNEAIQQHRVVFIRLAATLIALLFECNWSIAAAVGRGEGS